MTTPILPGVYSPVMTPFTRDAEPAVPQFVSLCRWLRRCGVGLAVFGTNSEANSLTVSERLDLLDALIGAGIEPASLMPGTGSCAVGDAVQLTRHATGHGCGGVLMLPPFYYKGVGDEGLFRYYARVIEAVADDRLRIFLYHIPPVSQVPISLPLIERLLRAFPGTVAGVKDSSGDWANTAAMIERFGPQGFLVYAGSETFLQRTLEAGGAGCITATGNVNPAAIVDACRRWREPGAQARQASLDATRAIFQKYSMIPAMKAAMAWKSGDGTWRSVRPPLVELDGGQCRLLEDELAAAGFELPDVDALRA